MGRGPVIVGLGASAGGLDALQRFFCAVPADTGMAFVVVLHLDPRRESILPELLAQAARLPVQAAGDLMPVCANQVYVIPPNALLTIEGGLLRLAPPLAAPGCRTPIDCFFRALARDQGDRAVAILFSGNGKDGMLGIKAVKERGGWALAQSPETASHPSMPRSALAIGVVDLVLAPEEMPARLREVVEQMNEPRDATGRGAADPEVAARLQAICALLRQKTGHDFSRYKPSTLTRRIRRRMLLLHVASAADYVERLERQPEEATLLLRDLLIGVTQFFRDLEAFEILERDVIPRLFEGKGAADAVRVWVIGCATGEEAYSLAILLREQMEQMENPPRVQVFATDIDEHSLETARHARYPQTITAQLSPERLQRFFVPEDGLYHLVREVRDLCIFSVHNIVHDPPFSDLDLLTCRNVLIYLEEEIQRKLVPLFHYGLRKGGYLFLGPTESLSGHPEIFRAVDNAHRIFQRVEMPARVPVEFPLGGLTHRPRMLPRARPARPPAREMGAGRMLERILLEEYAPPAVIINELGDILYFSGRTGKYLEPPSGGPSLNIHAMARRHVRLEVRTAVRKAVETRAPVVRQGIRAVGDDRVQTLDILVQPVSGKGEGEEAGLFMVVFQEVGPPRIKEQEESAISAEEPIIQHLESELHSTREELQATIQDVEAANEDLTSSNEELLSMNEELQSANEELQTSKEEMQAVNEELETLNAELSRKVEELNRARNDLQNLFESAHIATLFLDHDLRIKRFTPAATEMFRLIDSDIGRPVTDIAPRFTGGHLAAATREVLRTLAPQEVEVRKVEGDARYVMRIHPYRTSQNVIEGVVVTFLDVTELKRAGDSLRESEARERQRAAELQATMDAVPAAVLIAHDPEARVITGNRAAYEMLRMPLGQNLSSGAPDGERPVHVRYVRGGVETPPLEQPLQVAAGRGVEVRGFESDLVFDDGTVRHTLGHATPLLGEDGRPRGAVAAFVDITERVRAQDALREADRRKDEFLAMLAHELRNPLSAVASAVQVLGARAAPDASGQHAGEAAQRQVAHMTRLLDDLLDVARITRGKIELRRVPLDLAHVLEDALQMVRPTIEENRQHLSVSLPGEPLPVLGDPDRLNQVFANLLSNAAKYTPVGGHIWVEAQKVGEWGSGGMGEWESGRVGERETDGLGIAGSPTPPFPHSPTPAAEVRVRDDGVGISSEILPHVFDLFVQAERGVDRAQGGLGIGLTLVRRLVEMHSGSVAAHSDGPGQGSEFVVRLPLREGSGEGPGFRVQGSGPEAGAGPAPDTLGDRQETSEWLQPPQAQTEPRTLNPEPGPHAKTVLLVDDNADSAEMLAILLGLEGHTVIVAHDGPSALEVAAQQQPAVVLLDIGMPGMDGYAVARRLRQGTASADTVLVALTGYGQECDRERTQAAGFDHHLVKPVDMDALRRVLGGVKG